MPGTVCKWCLGELVNGRCPSCGMNDGFGPGFPGPLGRQRPRRSGLRTVFLILAVAAALAAFSLEVRGCAPEEPNESAAEPAPSEYVIIDLTQ